MTTQGPTESLPASAFDESTVQALWQLNEPGATLSRSPLKPGGGGELSQAQHLPDARRLMPRLDRSARRPVTARLRALRPAAAFDMGDGTDAPNSRFCSDNVTPTRRKTTRLARSGAPPPGSSGLPARGLVAGDVLVWRIRIARAASAPRPATNQGAISGGRCDTRARVWRLAVQRVRQYGRGFENREGHHRQVDAIETPRMRQSGINQCPSARRTNAMAHGVGQQSPEGCRRRRVAQRLVRTMSSSAGGTSPHGAARCSPR
jgi:hypothetical protein